MAQSFSVPAGTSGNISRLEFQQPEDGQDCVILKFFGEATYDVLTQDQGLKKLEFIAKGEIANVVFDFGYCNSMDSNVIGIMAMMLRKGKKVKVVCIKKSLPYEMLSSLMLIGMMEHHESLSEAV